MFEGTSQHTVVVRLGQSVHPTASRCFLESPRDVHLEGTNRAIGITDDMHHSLGSHFGIELHDSSLINLILARSEPFRIADDVGDPR